MVHSLRAGKTRSCGCIVRETAAARMAANMLRHGHKRRRLITPTYHTWSSMHSRCSNPKATSFKWYGAKGVRVCSEWASFDVFLRDMGERPSGRSMDRIDPTGNYEPGNCRWATPSEQKRNQRKKPKRDHAAPPALGSIPI